MNIRDRLSLQYMRVLTGSAEGRAHILNQIADAESSGESEIFDRALSRVEDPELARMIEKHRADEIRHAELFRECLARTGVDPGPVPSHLRMMDRLDRALGGFLSRPIVDGRGVMEAYLLLQVVEERALHQFAMLTLAFERVDPQTAAVFRAVDRDEQRHLRYCHAIARKYAPSTAVHDETLARFRRLEAECFRDNSAANMDYTLSRGFVPGALARTSWRAAFAFSLVAGVLPFTQYGQPSAAAA